MDGLNRKLGEAPRVRARHAIALIACALGLAACATGPRETASTKAAPDPVWPFLASDLPADPALRY